MEALVHANLQEALATQRLIQQWQMRESVGVDPALMARLPSVPALPPTALLGVTAGLVLGFLSWHLWVRQRRRLVEPRGRDISLVEPHGGDNFDQAPGSGFDDMDDGPAMEQPVAAAQPGPQLLVRAGLPHEERQSAIGVRPEPARGFDPQAAATEVVRVRKSLAEKRVARLPLPENEAARPVKQVRTVFEAPAFAEPAPDPAASQGGVLDLDLTAQPVPPPAPAEPLHVAAPEPEPAQGIHFEFPVAAENPQPPDAVHCAGHDYSVTLALAEESANLELWTEARELANEVVHAGDQGLRLEALSLLTRIDARDFAWA
jgi:hypothetical protein